MQNLAKVKKILKEHKKELEKKYNIKSIAILGSYVRGTQTKESDIDILVEFKKPITLIQFIKLEN